MVAFSYARVLALAAAAPAVLAGSAGTGEVVLATFDGRAGAEHTWKQMNDPVMGGKSTGSFSVSGSVGVFDGEVVDVPFLKAPGFIKVDTVDSSAFPDISGCKAIAVTAKADSDYTGYRLAFGNAHAPHGKFFAYGYKTHFSPTVGAFGTTVLPLESFTDYWDDATGNPIKTCQDDKVYCPDAETLRNVKTLSVWAEGIAGKVHLEIEKISATGCSAAADLLV